MNKKSKKKNISNWAKIHKQLAELYSDMSHIKTDDEFIKLTYSGTLTRLRSTLIKLLNIIENDEEFRWE